MSSFEYGDDENWFSGEAEDETWEPEMRVERPCADLESAEIALHKGMVATAEKCIRRSLQRDPTRLTAWDLLVEILIRKRQWTEAREVLVTRFEGHLCEERYFKLGLVCQKLGHDSEALTAYLNVLHSGAYCVKEAEVRQRLGRIYVKLSCFQEALRELRHAEILIWEEEVRLDPELRILIAETLLELGQPEAACVAFESLDFAPSQTPEQRHRLLYEKGRCLEVQERLLEAGSYYEQALSLEPLPEYREALTRVHSLGIGIDGVWV